MHCVHSDDAPYSQSVMDRLMGEGRVKVKTYRERQQRWLVNQRYARIILTTMAMLTGGSGVGGIVFGCAVGGIDNVENSIVVVLVLVLLLDVSLEVELAQPKTMPPTPLPMRHPTTTLTPILLLH
eukprot:scaffold54561_cov40-Cyclotella_meneghiniana.AAC.2